MKKEMQFSKKIELNVKISILARHKVVLNCNEFNECKESNYE